MLMVATEQKHSGVQPPMFNFRNATKCGTIQHRSIDRYILEGKN